MLTRNSVTKRYLQLRRGWLKLRRGGPSWELATADSAVRALGWVLGVNPEVGVQPRYLAAETTSPDRADTPESRLRGVRLTGAWTDVWSDGYGTGVSGAKGNNKKPAKKPTKKHARRYWLLEVPANREAMTEYWAVFLSERQVGELALAFGAALFGASASALSRLSSVVDTRGDTKNVPVDAIDAMTVKDVRAFIEGADWSEWSSDAAADETAQTGGAA